MLNLDANIDCNLMRKDSASEAGPNGRTREQVVRTRVEPIVMLDLDGRVYRWSADAERLLGFGAGLITGAHYSVFFGDEAEGRRALEEARVWGRSHGTTNLLDRWQRPVAVNFVFLRVQEEGPQPAGFALAVREAERADEVHAEAFHDAAPSKPLKVLLVDDDDFVRPDIEEHLCDLGYEVLAARSGDEAMSILRRTSDIDLLLTDVVMPGQLGGEGLALAARRLRPGLRVLFLSGYLQAALEQRGDLTRGVAFLPKPYRKVQLARALGNLLEGPGASAG